MRINNLNYTRQDRNFELNNSRSTSFKGQNEVNIVKGFANEAATTINKTEIKPENLKTIFDEIQKCFERIIEGFSSNLNIRNQYESPSMIINFIDKEKKPVGKVVWRRYDELNESNVTYTDYETRKKAGIFVQESKSDPSQLEVKTFEDFI